jgi:hypothetical protein
MRANTESARFDSLSGFVRIIADPNKHLREASTDRYQRCVSSVQGYLQYHNSILKLRQ